ncbi:MAG: ATP-binding cassette domain-containing protein, partial [Eubacteriales bacterium]|nr:ATP-binding cassette domain-containing protein [Eubacteriales bacterium]
MKQALELKKVSKKYEGFLLDQIDIELPRGCIMGLIGENGAGKSTTIKLILDLISRDNGTIMVLGGDNLENLKAIKENIGVVLDESCFPENLNLWDINRIMKNIYLTWNEKLFWDYTTRFALPSDKKTVKEYSHGMKMKLAIAIALSHDSKLLLLDEATSGLDPVARDEILDVFREFIQDEERSIL